MIRPFIDAFNYFSDHGVVTPIIHAGIDTAFRSVGLYEGKAPRSYAYWQTPRGEYELYSMMYNTPFIGGMLKHDEAMKEMDRNLDRYGLTYEDVLKGNLRKTMGVTNGISVGGGFNFVSSNLTELYK